MNTIQPSAIVDEGAQLGAGMVFADIHNPRATVPRKSEYQRTLVRQATGHARAACPATGEMYRLADGV